MSMKEMTRRSWLGGLMALMPGVELMARRCVPKAASSPPKALGDGPGALPRVGYNLEHLAHGEWTDGEWTVKWKGPAGGINSDVFLIVT